MRREKTDRVGEECEGRREGGEKTTLLNLYPKLFGIFHLSFSRRQRFRVAAATSRAAAAAAGVQVVFLSQSPLPLKSLTSLRLPLHSQIQPTARSAPLPGRLFPITTAADVSAVCSALSTDGIGGGGCGATNDADDYPEVFSSAVARFSNTHFYSASQTATTLRPT